MTLAEILALTRLETKQRSIRFPVAMAAALEALAEQHGCTFTDVVIAMCELGLPRQDDEQERSS